VVNYAVGFLQAYTKLLNIQLIFVIQTKDNTDRDHQLCTNSKAAIRVRWSSKGMNDLQTEEGTHSGYPDVLVEQTIGKH
jgi:hypothetical protein